MRPTNPYRLRQNPRTLTHILARALAHAHTQQFIDVTFELAALKLNIHVLTTLAVFGTVALGCALEGALLLVLFATAHAVEERLTRHAQGDLRALWASVPATASLVTLRPDGTPDLSAPFSAPCADVGVGALVLVLAGQQVPIDGEVVHGAALVSLEHITGEAAPVSKRVGDEVPAGALNADGVLVVRTLRLAADSTPARIARLTAAAQARRPRVQRLLDTLSDRYSLGVLLATFGIVVAGPALLGVPLSGPGGATYRAFAFLSAAAPCALLMAPLAYVAAVGAAAQRGALVRGGLTLDALAECGAVALDKTGTLTTGVLALTSIEAVTVALVGDSGASASASQSASHLHDEALAVAAALERGTSHPVARAVLAAAAAASAQALDVVDFHVEQGAGVEGRLPASCRVGGGAPATSPPRRARFGAIDYVAALLTPDEAAALRAAAAAGARTDVVSALLIAPADATDASGERTLRLFFFSDGVRARAAAAVALLRAAPRRGGGPPLRVVMLTGDNEASARAMATRLGLPLEDVRAGLSPLDKMRAVEALREELAAPSWKGGRRVVMVGDGINDAPALAAADVGIAIASTPSDAAAAAADVLLLHAGGPGVALLPELLALGRDTRAIVRQNIGIAAASIALAALPAGAGVFPLWVAVLLHEGSTLGVALNSMRLLAPPAVAAVRAAAGRAAVRAAKAGLVCALVAALASAALLAWRAAAAAGLIGAASSSAAAAASSHHGIIAAASVTATPALPAALHAARSAWAGLAAGALHTLTGPDHLAALTPLTIGRSRLQSTLLGGLWGCGHNTGQVIFGIAFLILRERLNLDLLEVGSKALVGATLLFIGVMGAREAFAESEEEAEAADEKAAAACAEGDDAAECGAEGEHGHSHAHAHAQAHSHGHSHSHGGAHGHSHGGWGERLLASVLGGADKASSSSSASPAPRRFAAATYATGLVHGLQPDALLVLLPALALPRASAAAYLATFLGGTVLAMASYTAFIGAGTERLRVSAPGMTKRIALVSSIVALAIGVWLLGGALCPRLLAGVAARFGGVFAAFAH
jgi:heavy metal translocating P-type ATPase